MRNASLVTLVFISSLSSTALAQTAEGNATIHLGVDNHDGPNAQVILQSGRIGEHRFGLRARSGLTRDRFINGHVTDQGATVELTPRAYWSLLRRGGSRFGLLTEVGARAVLSAEDTPAGDLSLAVTTRIAPTFTQRLTPDLSIFTAIHIDTDVAVSPAVELDTNAFPTELGLRYWLSDNLALTAVGRFGGALGYGGDGSKVQYGASVGLEYALDARQDADSGDTTPGVGAFLDTGWRGYAIGDHLSHGPEVRAGVALLGGALKVGVGVIGRPGPMNPQEFDLDLPDGQTYRGKSTLRLRSDGATFGLLVAPTLPLNDWLDVEIPITFGQAAYGFYFQGEDRDTPDDRRVSEWENELQDERDSSFALGLDAGVRLKARIPGAPWIQPMLGVHYLLTPGYDAFLSSDYGGLSVAAGVQLGIF